MHALLRMDTNHQLPVSPHIAATVVHPMGMITTNQKTATPTLWMCSTGSNNKPLRAPPPTTTPCGTVYEDPCQPIRPLPLRPRHRCLRSTRAPSASSNRRAIRVSVVLTDTIAGAAKAKSCASWPDRRCLWLRSACTTCTGTCSPSQRCSRTTARSSTSRSATQ